MLLDFCNNILSLNCKSKERSQARNQESFRTGEFSWKYGNLINIYLIYNTTKKCLAGKNFLYFLLLETLFPLEQHFK